MCGRHALRTHFIEPDLVAAGCEGPCGLDTGESGADNGDHFLIMESECLRTPPRLAILVPMDAIQAEQMAKAWTEAWNNHDLDALMEHYAEDVVFHSPFVKLLQVEGETTVCGKTALREYFRRGMEAYPHSRFQLHRTGVGVDSIVMNYISVNGMLANELHVLNEEGKAVEVRCHYSDAV